MTPYCSQKQGIVKKKKKGEVQEEERDERRHWGGWDRIRVEGLWLADTFFCLFFFFFPSQLNKHSKCEADAVSCTTRFHRKAPWDGI